MIFRKEKARSQMTNLQKTQGALTVEAAIVLPIFICVIVSVAFFTKVIYVHEIMQHAINEVATNIAETSYVFNAAGINHGSVKDGTQMIVDTVEEMVFPQSQDNDDTVPINQTLFDEILNEPALEPVMEELHKYFLGNINNEILLQQGLQIITKKLVKNNLKTHTDTDVDKRLKALHIIDGFQGLDFTESRFFAGDTEDIDIVLMYCVKLPLPFNVLPDIHITQRAVTRAWLDGGEERVKDIEENIWELTPWERGRLIQQMQPYKRNVSSNFPVITRFKDGVAIKVRSINLNDASYQNNTQVRSQIRGEINKIYAFEGAERGETKIQKEDVVSKKVIIVVPKGTIRKTLLPILEQCKAYAVEKNITLRIDEL